ncbi:ABC transporter permease [Roseixanthobacter pseudopolyaromaticivorans]|uniref:ABC transporter permease n=1 Tax=Xanthobacteraceae TaxID=335928 RepID=UPI00372C787C
MIGAIMKAMGLTLLRDKGALVMTFILPPLMFLVFAAVFTGVSGDDAPVKTAIADASGSEGGHALFLAMHNAPLVKAIPVKNEAAVREAVRSGDADAGLVIVSDPSAGGNAAPLLILADPGRAAAAGLLMAHVQSLISERLPEVGLKRLGAQMQSIVGTFTPEQTEQFNLALEASAESVAKGEKPRGGDFFARQTVDSLKALPTVTYYAGAIAVLFLLFSSVQGAASLVEERRSGIFDRLVMMPGGSSVMVLGKFAFITLQGVLQVTLLFAVAGLVYGVAVLPHFGSWLITTIAAAAATSSLALALACAARTRQQAQTLSTFAVLMLSAIGGSMVPRFLMPAWLQSAGWITPNAWVIEAYQASLWRGAALNELAPALFVLICYAVAGLIISMVLARRHVRLG